MRCPETFVSPVLFKSLCQNSGIQCMSQNCTYLRISRDGPFGEHSWWLPNVGPRNFRKTIVRVSLSALHRLNPEARSLPQLPPGIQRRSRSERLGRLHYQSANSRDNLSNHFFFVEPTSVMVMVHARIRNALESSLAAESFRAHLRQ
jgi:hypothetical protein